MKKTNLMLLRMILQSKSQFIAILLIIITGISVFTGMNMVAVNMQSTVDLYYSQNSFPHLFVKTNGFPENETKKIESLPGVKNASGRVTLEGRMLTEDPNERVNLRLHSTSSDNNALCKNTLMGGTLNLKKAKDVLVVDQFAIARGIEIKDKITIQVGGLQYSLDVVGIVANPENVYMMENAQSLLPDSKTFGVLYVSESFAQWVTGLPGSYNELLVEMVIGTDEDQLKDDMEDEMEAYGIKQSIDREGHLSNSVLDSEISGLDLMADSLPIIFLIVAGLILMMMLGRMVKRDRMKIGVLKAMGYSNRSVLMHYVGYAGLAGILGGLIGSLAGMALAGWMTRYYLTFFHIPIANVEVYYYYILLGIGVSTFLCIIAGIIGARGVLKISPADAMRSDAPKTGKNILFQRISWFWKRLSFSNKMILKNIFRSKKRSAFVLAGVALTFGMMLFTNSMTGVIDQMMNKHFTEFQKMEYNITFVQPVEESTIYDMTYLVDVDAIEGKIEYPFTLSSGNKEKTVTIIGLDENTQFFQFNDSQGDKVPIPKRGILLSSNLAKALDVVAGDSIRIKSFIPGKEDVYTRVSQVVTQTLGINGFMSIDYMGQLLLEKNLITGVFLDSRDAKINEKLIKVPNISSVMSSEASRAVYQEYMTMMILAIGFMVVFSGLLGFAIVYNATIVNLSSREMEFSSLRVLGFTRNEIFRMLLKENNILLVVGIIIGIPVGTILSAYSGAAFSTDIYSIAMTPTIGAFVLSTIYTIIFVLIAQLATYRKVQSLDFLKALKSRES
jgi:putative ABC transport system permease protein